MRDFSSILYMYKCGILWLESAVGHMIQVGAHTREKNARSINISGLCHSLVLYLKKIDIEDYSHFHSALYNIQTIPEIQTFT